MFKECEFVDITFESVSSECHRSANAIEEVGFEVKDHTIVDKERYIVVRTVNSKCDMVPIAISAIDIGDWVHCIFAVHDEIALFDSKSKVRGRREECSVLRCCSEPEHQRLVLYRCAREEVSCKFNRLIGRYMQRNTFCLRPACAMCKEGSAIGFVVEDIALTFVKRIISE